MTPIAYLLFCTICLLQGSLIAAVNSYYKNEGIILFKMTNFKRFSEGSGPMSVFSDSVFINGMPWKISIEYNGAYLGFHLCNDSDKKDFAWSCRASYQLRIVTATESVILKKEIFRHFNAYNKCLDDNKFITFQQLMDPQNGLYDEKEDAVAFKAEVDAEKPRRTLDIHNEDGLLVNNELVYVNKYLLSAQSEVFKKKFFGVEKMPNETPKIQIENIENAVEKFDQLISIVNLNLDSSSVEIEAYNAEELLQLANHFQMKPIVIPIRRGQINFKMPNFKAFLQGDGPNCASSDSVSINGTRWKIRIKHQREHDDYFEMAVVYEVENDLFLWYNISGSLWINGSNAFSYHFKNCKGFSAGTNKFSNQMHNYMYDANNDTMTFRAELAVNCPKAYQSFTYDADDTLLINGQVVNVNKYLLAAHSEFFKFLFFELNSEENGNKPLNIPIDEIENPVESFNQLISFVNSPTAQLDDECVETVLLLADRFLLDSIEKRCVSFLMDYSKKRYIEKLKLAHQYGIIGMKDKLLSNLRYVEVQQYFKDILFLLEYAIGPKKMFHALKKRIEELNAEIKPSSSGHFWEGQLLRANSV